MTGLAESPPRADVRIRSLRDAPHELRIIVTCPSETTVWSVPRRRAIFPPG